MFEDNKKLLNRGSVLMKQLSCKAGESRRKKIHNALAVITMSLASYNQAALASVYEDTRYDSCFAEAGREYSIDPQLLKAIGIQESSLNNHAVNNASAGFPDISLMQINGWWLDKPYFISNGITRKTLLNDPCLSIKTGAWILAGNFALNGVNWESVGGYNAGFSSKREAVAARAQYIAYIQKHLSRLRGLPYISIEAKVSAKFRTLSVDDLRTTFSGGAHNYRFENRNRSFAFDIVRKREFSYTDKLVGNF